METERVKSTAFGCKGLFQRGFLLKDCRGAARPLLFTSCRKYIRHTKRWRRARILLLSWRGAPTWTYGHSGKCVTSIPACAGKERKIPFVRETGGSCATRRSSRITGNSTRILSNMKYTITAFHSRISKRSSFRASRLGIRTI